MKSIGWNQSSPLRILDIKHFWNGNYQSYLNLKLISGLGKAQTQYLNKSKNRKNCRGGGKVVSCLKTYHICNLWDMNTLPYYNYLLAVNKFINSQMGKLAFKMWIIILLKVDKAMNIKHVCSCEPIKECFN